MSKPIRVLVADDHPVVRRGIISCLAKNEGLEIVGEAADGAEAVRKCEQLLPDLVLMDVDMPRLSGLAVTELLRKHLPHIKVLIITMHSRSEFVMRMIRAGASGYVLKQAPVDELVRAIEAVSAGQSFFSPELARVALNGFVRGRSENDELSVLTCREREVLIQIAEGYSNKEIANQLGVGVRTIETHRERVMRKLQIHSIAGLTRFAIAHGLVALQAPYPLPN